jgi:hypothetical protein
VGILRNFSEENKAAMKFYFVMAALKRRFGKGG